MKKILSFVSGVALFWVAPFTASAQMLYMDPNSGTIYNGFGLPRSGPSPSRVLDFLRQQWLPSTRRTISPTGTVRGGFGVMQSGPDLMMAFCLQNLCFVESSLLRIT